MVRFPSSAWSFGHVQFIATPRTVARQAPLSMEFSREEYWSGLPFPLRLWGNRGLEADGNLIWVNTGGETGDFRDGSRRGPSVVRFWVRGDQVKCQEITGKWGAPTTRQERERGQPAPRPAHLLWPLRSTPGADKCAQPCLTLCDLMSGSPPGSTVHGILQARIPEWVAISSLRRSSQPGDATRASCVSCSDRQVLCY